MLRLAVINCWNATGTAIASMERINSRSRRKERDMAYGGQIEGERVICQQKSRRFWKRSLANLRDSCSTAGRCLQIFRRLTNNVERPALGFIIQAADIFTEDTQRNQLHTA